MPSAERHPSEVDLLALALAPELPRGAHVEGCPECRRKVEGLAAGREHLLDLAVIAGAVSPAPAPAPFLDVGRVLADAEALVRAAEEGEEPFVAALSRAASRDGFAHAALHAAQIASRLPLRSPQRTVLFARRLQDAIATGPGAESNPARLAVGVSKSLESQGLLYVGDADEAVRAAADGLRLLEEHEAPLLLLSRARYFLGSCLWGASRYPEAIRLLEAARDGFASDGQDSWVGRAEGAIGLVHFSEARFLPALRAFDSALARLDPSVDPGPVASIEQNRAGILMNLGRLAESRAAFGAALELALRHGLLASATTIRVNLLNLGLDERAYEEVRSRGEKIVAQCEREGLAVDAYYARIALAEAQAALGNYGAVRTLVEALRGDAPPEVRDDPDATALLARLDAGDRDETADRLRRLRHYLAGRDRFEAARRA